MGFNCGIVGMPNVGKSTLFNALTATAAAKAHNYPFTTITPNVGRVAVPDPRLEVVARLTGSGRNIPAHLEFVDIAGLVGGASKGEGMGNQFLGVIREVDAILHVLRCFEDPDVTHVADAIDPVRDAEMVETELLLADLESLDRRMSVAAKGTRDGDKTAKTEIALMEKVLGALREGRAAASVDLTPSEAALGRLQLLTAKPVLYVCNVEESAAAKGNRFSEAATAFAESRGAGCVVISAAIEAEVAELATDAERNAFLATIGLAQTGLTKTIRAGYRLLDLVTFFTANPKEAHAWTVPRGTQALAAAERVHSDFAHGFIAAEVIAFDDFKSCEREQGVRESGRIRAEGKTYVVQDGDIIKFRFNT